MTHHSNVRDQAPYWSLPGLAEGAWRTAPLLPGTVIFAMAFGTIAAQKGLTLADKRYTARRKMWSDAGGELWAGCFGWFGCFWCGGWFGWFGGGVGLAGRSGVSGACWRAGVGP